MDLATLLALFRAHAWIALAALFIGALLRAVKGDTPLPYVTPRVRPWLALGLGLVAGVLNSLVAKVPLGTALFQGFAAAATAIAGHESLIESLRGGVEFFASPSDPKPPCGPSGEGSACSTLPPVAIHEKEFPMQRSALHLRTGFLVLTLLLPGCGATLAGAEIAAVAGGIPLVECVGKDLLAGRDTFEDLKTDCKAATIAEVEGIVETLAAQPAPPATPPAIPSPIPALAAKVHHAAKAAS